MIWHSSTAAGLLSLLQLLTEVTNAAAFNSLVLGELPALFTKQEASNLLSESGLLSTVLDYSQPAQLRLSLAEMGVYEQHVAMAEEADEDFFGNFS
ncbi:uncharacterized protein HaLaN_14200 [Haematococcus lacustris]|uniref:Uncharacterized protein n=1 Tax=Haematococcus lacustris TaxID=44745 RepID=A0A699Z7X7_HAELA|nr:uncharacterized protein HaLaN_14200 [Haematococcus lacustris]